MKLFERLKRFKVAEIQVKLRLAGLGVSDRAVYIWLAQGHFPPYYTAIISRVVELLEAEAEKGEG